LVERSAPARPDWIVLTPTALGHKYFVGESQGPSQDKAKDAAIADMLKRYAEYLGVDFSVLVHVHQEEIKQLQDEIHRTERRVVTDAEAMSQIVTRGTELRGQYWEKWDRGDGYYYRYWTLGQVEERFIEEEAARIKGERQQELPVDMANSDLEVQVDLPGGVSYKAGDTVRFVVSANTDCHLYMLNAYGDGQIACQHYGRLAQDRRLTLTCPAKFGGEKQEDVKFVVCDKPLDIERALKQVYPASVVMALRQEARQLEAEYAEKTVSILIESR
jgi:hypothetical protein